MFINDGPRRERANCYESVHNVTSPSLSTEGCGKFDLYNSNEIGHLFRVDPTAEECVNSYKASFQVKTYSGRLQRSVFLAESEHPRFEQSYELVGLWVSDSGYG